MAHNSSNVGSHAAVLILSTLASALVAAPPVILDGETDEWSVTPPVVLDLEGDARGALDLGAVHASSDDRYVYWRLEVGREVNLQRLPQTVELLLDADGDPTTGRRQGALLGVDLAVVLSPRDHGRPDQPGQGVTVRWAGQGPPGPEEGRDNPAYGVDFAAAPTHSSTWFEMRMRRGSAWPDGPSIFTSGSYSIAVRSLDDAGRPDDVAGPIIVSLKPVSGTDATIPDADPIARPAEAWLRVVSWNVERGSIFADPDPFRTVLAALRPDVILLQEIPEEHSADELRSLLQDMLPRAGRPAWNVVYGEGGGPLRCAVASWRPIEPLTTVRLIPYPRRPDRSVRVAGARLRHDDVVLAFASVHLTCCGGLGEERDERRQTEATLINDGLRRARTADGIDALVVAGDLNLVGSPRPRDLLAAGLADGATDLRAAAALQLDGCSNVSWRDPRQPFGPGRLDFLLHGGASLELVRSFTFDSADVVADVRQRYELNANDTHRASDHLPIVADFAIGKTADDTGG